MAADAPPQASASRSPPQSAARSPWATHATLPSCESKGDGIRRTAAFAHKLFDNLEFASLSRTKPTRVSQSHNKKGVILMRPNLSLSLRLTNTEPLAEPMINLRQIRHWIREA